MIFLTFSQTFLSAFSRFILFYAWCFSVYMKNVNFSFVSFQFNSVEKLFMIFPMILCALQLQLIRPPPHFVTISIKRSSCAVLLIMLMLKTSFFFTIVVVGVFLILFLCLF